DVAELIVDERDVLDPGPGRGPLLIARGEHDREALLSVSPVAREAIALDQNAAGVLELQQVLDRPPPAVVVRMLVPPRPGPGDIIGPNLDVGRHETFEPRILSTEHHVLPGRLEVVVHDLEGSWATPANNCLGVIAHFLQVGEI